MIDLLILCKLRHLHEIVGREEAGNHGVIESAVHVDDFHVGIVLVAGETPGKLGIRQGTSIFNLFVTHLQTSRGPLNKI